jgi:hypothetical protein
MFKGGGIGALFGKKPPSSPSAAAAAGGGRSPLSAGGLGALLGGGAGGGGAGSTPASAKKTSSTPASNGRGGGGGRQDIPDGDMPALFARAQDLLEKTRKRAEMGSQSVRGVQQLPLKRSQSASCLSLSSPFPTFRPTDQSPTPHDSLVVHLL